MQSWQCLFNPVLHISQDLLHYSHIIERLMLNLRFLERKMLGDIFLFIFKPHKVMEYIAGKCYYGNKSVCRS